jgi:hypothetical protein
MNKSTPTRSQGSMPIQSNNSSSFIEKNHGYIFSNSEVAFEKASVFDGISQNLMARLIQKMDAMDKPTNVKNLKT